MNVTRDDFEGGRGDGEEEGVVVVVGNVAQAKAWEALGADDTKSSDLSRFFLFCHEMARWGERQGVIYKRVVECGGLFVKLT